MKEDIQRNLGKIEVNEEKVIIRLDDDAFFDNIDMKNLVLLNATKPIIIYYWWNDIEYCVEIPVGSSLCKLVDNFDKSCTRLKLASTFGVSRTGRKR